MDNMKKITKPMPRRDAAGHLDPTYAEKLRTLGGESSREKDAKGFVPETHGNDSLTEELGEQFVKAATSGEDSEADTLNAVVAEEVGGPFVVTNSGEEFARGTDPSNPDDADREAFPTTQGEG